MPFLKSINRKAHKGLRKERKERTYADVLREELRDTEEEDVRREV